MHGGYFATSCEFALLPGYFDRHSRRVGGHQALEAAEKQEEDRRRINDPVKASSSEGEAKFLGKGEAKEWVQHGKIGIADLPVMPPV